MRRRYDLDALRKKDSRLADEETAQHSILLSHVMLGNVRSNIVRGQRLGGRAMSPTVVRYRLDDGTAVGFELEAGESFRPAGTDQVAGTLREAVGPAVAAARTVLEKVKEAKADKVEIKFGVKASGTMNWLVAKVASEGNFEVTLTWEPGSAPSGAEPPAASG